MLLLLQGCNEIRLQVPSSEVSSNRESNIILDASLIEHPSEYFFEQQEEAHITDYLILENKPPEKEDSPEKAYEGVPEQRPDDGSWAQKISAELFGARPQVVVDSENNIYIAASLNGPITIENKTYRSPHKNRLLIAKLDKHGKWLWVIFIPSTKHNFVSGLLYDETKKQLSLVGVFQGTVFLGKTKWSSENYRSSYILRITHQGKQLGAVLLNSTKEMVAEKLILGENGSFLLAGYFSGKVHQGTFNLDIQKGLGLFVVCLKNDNRWEWGVQTHIPEGTIASVSLQDIMYFSGKHILLLGIYRKDMTVGKIKLTTKDNTAQQFLAGLTHSGQWLWAKKLGVPYDLHVETLTASPKGKLYATGRFSKKQQFGKTILQTANLTPYPDLFVAEMDWVGDWLWAKSAGSPTGFDMGRAISTTPNGNIIVTGTFREKSHFGNTTLESKGQSDIFVASLSPQGKWLWVKQGRSKERAKSLFITSDKDGHPIINGGFDGDISLEGIKLHGSTHHSTLFIWKLPRNTGKAP